MVYRDIDVKTVTLSLDTSAYTAADVLADTQVITDAVRHPGGSCKLISLTVLDKDDQTAAAMDLYFLDSNVSLGTENGAIAITDADAASILGVVPIASGDFKDLINSKLACIKNIGLLLKAASASSDLYIAAVTAGTPTQTASGIVVRLCLEQN